MPDGSAISDVGLEALADSPHMAGLHTLDIGDNGISEAGAKALAASASISALRSLDVGDNEIGKVGAKALADSPHMAGLHTLDIGDNKIGDSGVKALAASAYLTGLHTLDVGDNRISKAGAKALALSACITGLHTLNISANRIGKLGIKALAESVKMTGLRVLDVNYSGIGEAGATALAASVHIVGLRKLDIGCNELGASGAIALATSPNMASLHTLDIVGNGIGDVGAEALASSPHMADLQTLNIGENKISDFGARMIARSEMLKNLCRLHIGKNTIKNPETVIYLCEKLVLQFPSVSRYGGADEKAYISVHGNPLIWKGRSGRIPDAILYLSDPFQLRSRLEELRSERDRAQLFVARVVMAGPTGHGKSHLAAWLSAATEEQKRSLRRRQERGPGGAGTWGADRIQAKLPKAEHEQGGLPDLDLWVIDCGGHPQQLQSHHNLYFSSWNRSVFVLCVRRDHDFVESWGQYHLGLITDLQTLSIGRRRDRWITTHDRVRERQLPGPFGDPERTLLPVVLVPTHGDVAVASGRMPVHPSVEALARDHELLDVVKTEAWDAISGVDILEVKRAIGRQMAKLPELRGAVATYVPRVIAEVERRFSPDAAHADAPMRRSMSFADFKTACDDAHAPDVEGRHLFTLRLLDNLGYVVAPGCHGAPPSLDDVLLNPRFVQEFLYRRLLNPDPRPSDGIIPKKDYKQIVLDLSKSDRNALESLMRSCLVAFEIKLRGDVTTGWLVPDLLIPSDVWPAWDDASWTATLSVPQFLNECVFFEFVRDERDAIERTVGEKNVVRLSIARNGCVLVRDDLRARVRFDARARTIAIEVRGGAQDRAEQLCRILADRFERATDARADVMAKGGGPNSAAGVTHATPASKGATARVCRLRVDRASRNIYLDGVPFPHTSDAACAVVENLILADGGYVHHSRLLPDDKSLFGELKDRVKNALRKLDPEIRNLIEGQEGSGGGRRLIPSAFRQG